MKKIFLLGYMGSGKSTIGPLLAAKLSYKFLDFDAYIEKMEGKSISKIFKDEGEIYFRKAENNYLKQLISSSEDGPEVIALGGGTPCYSQNMDYLKTAMTTTVYLNSSYKELTKRLWINKQARPLLNSLESYEALEEYVRKHLFERSYYYNQADIVVKAQDETPEQLASKIIKTLF
ncbi:shikimate kinase [Dokdonia sp. Hel_I_53]|uniref:shikimate kinase n=1 Tax=Dokdonia sp. Hel_I_53 TaxID=1566287 RepID=UPI0011A4AA37|nr:shikimate kinase [Dokdonia sp. Hel_I_53]